MITSQSIRWQEANERVSRMIDSLGQPIDPGIRDVVVGLQFIGVQTLASCEGHLDHGSAAPWIDLGNPKAKPFARIAMQKMMEVDMLRQSGADVEQRQGVMREAEEAKRQARMLHLSERLKLLPYLERFYQNRSVPYNCRLIINPADWIGIGRLENQGADLQDIFDLGERQQKLHLYQQEMAHFASFLKAVI